MSGYDVPTPPAPGPGIRLHARTLVVQRAHSAILNESLDLATEHGLTWVELAIVLSECARRALTYVLREERHPDDPSRKADEV